MTQDDGAEEGARFSAWFEGSTAAAAEGGATAAAEGGAVAEGEATAAAEGGAAAAAEGGVAAAGVGGGNDGGMAANICTIELTVCDGMTALLDAAADAAGSSAGMAFESKAAVRPLFNSSAKHNPLLDRFFLGNWCQSHHR